MSELPKIYPGEKPHDILAAQQFTREWLIEDLFPLTKQMSPVMRGDVSTLLEGKAGFHAFYEKSTRTRVSFGRAITLLGGTFDFSEDMSKFSSATVGETLVDTTRILEGYEYDYMVLRHFQEGGALAASDMVDIPVINAGDGQGQHPTQTLLDTYTIYEQLGHIGDQTWLLSGDLLRGRTTNSLAYISAIFPSIRLLLVSPPHLRVKLGIREYLDERGVDYEEHTELRPLLSQADMVYVTREQLERPLGNNVQEPIDHEPLQDLSPEVEAQKPATLESYTNYRVDLEALDLVQKHARVLHPLPRGPELPPEVDIDPRVVCFKQAKNGLYVRMALFKMILG